MLVTESELNAFLADLPWTDLAEVAAPFMDNDLLRAESLLRTLQGEAHLGLALVKPYLTPGARVLEVGSGMGLLSAFLASRGVDVVALEPGLGGFSVNAALAEAVAFGSLKRLAIPAQELDGEQFDFIYSINVLEHIPNLAEAIEGMARVLSPKGTMVHTCPNYLVPFEPHFGIPLVPVWPRWTQLILPRMRSSELWQSLNFITVPRMRRIAGRRALDVSFQKGLMYRAFERLDTDPAFRERQARGLVLFAYRVMKATGGLALIKRLPPVLATPMVFELTHRPSGVAEIV